MKGEMPRPTGDHQRLTQLEGTWVGEDHIHPSPWEPNGAQAVGKMVARMTLGGFYLILDWQQERNGHVNFQGHGVLGWDPRGKCYTMHWFDSSGIEHGEPSFGSWDGSVLTLQHESTHLGHSRQVYEVGDGEYHFTLQNSRDGREWATFMDGVYRRIGAGS
jgi:hypothetical protein